MCNGCFVTLALPQAYRTVVFTSRINFAVVVTAFFCIAIMNAEIKLIHHQILEGIQTGEVSHPGPRLGLRGPRSLDSRSALRNRGGPTLGVPESRNETSENSLTMLLAWLFVAHR